MDKLTEIIDRAEREERLSDAETMPESVFYAWYGVWPEDVLS